MRVAVLSSEAVPYSKTGGLADVSGALPKALRQIGLDAFLITPCYLQTKGEYLWHKIIVQRHFTVRQMVRRHL
jgi:starch synthase